MTGALRRGHRDTQECKQACGNKGRYCSDLPTAWATRSWGIRRSSQKLLAVLRPCVFWLQAVRDTGHGDEAACGHCCSDSRNHTAPARGSPLARLALRCPPPATHCVDWPAAPPACLSCPGEQQALPTIPEPTWPHGSPEWLHRYMAVLLLCTKGHESHGTRSQSQRVLLKPVSPRRVSVRPVGLVPRPLGSSTCPSNTKRTALCRAGAGSTSHPQ